MQYGLCIWLTGLPCAGKTTLATQLAREMEARGRDVMVFDGDAVRMNLSSDLGFSREHRHANALRVAAEARAVVERGAIAICALVSPYRESRAQARDLVGAANFIEVYVDTPIEICEARDVKGMYRLARAGKLDHFTGVSDPYEAPLDPDVRVTGKGEPGDAIASTLGVIERRIGCSFGVL
jgi:adenylyl-sulfate kinase